MNKITCLECGCEFLSDLDHDIVEQICPDCLSEMDYCPEDDGQPSEYEEWQDVYGGDVEEYGTYGEYDNGDW